MKAFFVVRGHTERELEEAANAVLASFGESHWDFRISADAEVQQLQSDIPVLWRGDVEAWTTGMESELPEMGHPEYRGRKGS